MPFEPQHGNVDVPMRVNSPSLPNLPNCCVLRSIANCMPSIRTIAEA
jgi:hypothetical protein